MKSFKEFLIEKVIAPSTTPNTMSLWHGGNLDVGASEEFAHKKGRYEYGAGLYLTTHYGTAQKYSKGSRKLYLVTIKKGNDANHTKIDTNKVLEFIDDYVIKNKRKEVIQALHKWKDSEGVPAYIFINIIINRDAIKPTYTNAMRKFLVSQGIDYLTVPNAFGWHEMMIVLFNMKIIINYEVIAPKDKIETFDLPTSFNESIVESINNCKYFRKDTQECRKHGHCKYLDEQEDCKDYE